MIAPPTPIGPPPAPPAPAPEIDEEEAGSHMQVYRSMQVPLHTTEQSIRLHMQTQLAIGLAQ